MAQQLDPRRGILIRFVPHQAQRYETVGDWIAAHGEWLITVSDMGDWRCNVLVALHELVEMALCHQRGIPEDAVTAFDVAFEAQRQPGDESEPGDHPEAPYRREHRFAENLERQLAHELSVDWSEYERRIASL